MVLEFAGEYIDVLKQPITEPSRRFAKNLLKDALIRNSEEIENLIFEKYGKSPKDYIAQITKLSTFLDSRGIIGRYSNFAREKIQQGIYTPERILELTDEELLPEVFLKDTATESLKENIKYYVGVSQVNSNITSFNNVLNPTKRRKTQSEHGKRVPILTDLGSVAEKHIKNLCYNSSWESRDADTIICKGRDSQSGKTRFFCLDTADLARQIKNTGKAINKFTGQPISEELVNKIRKRYPNLEVPLAQIGDNELIRLRDILKKYEQVYEHISPPDFLKKVGIDGINPYFREYIPDLVMEAFLDGYSKDKETGANYLLKFMETTIAQLKSTIEKGIENIPTEERQELLKQGVFGERPELQQPEPESGSEGEEDTDIQHEADMPEGEASSSDDDELYAKLGTELKIEEESSSSDEETSEGELEEQESSSSSSSDDEFLGETLQQTADFPSFDKELIETFLKEKMDKLQAILKTAQKTNKPELEAKAKELIEKLKKTDTEQLKELAEELKRKAKIGIEKYLS